MSLRKKGIGLPVIPPRLTHRNSTDFHSSRSQHRHLFGDEVIDRTHEIWGVDANGEIRSGYKPSGQPGVRILFSHLFCCLLIVHCHIAVVRHRRFPVSPVLVKVPGKQSSILLSLPLHVFETKRTNGTFRAYSSKQSSLGTTRSKRCIIPCDATMALILMPICNRR